jgi:Holliday junction DNA helicase RuvA
VGLGWNQKAAADAVGQVLGEGDEPVGDEDVAGVLRAALRALGGGRG